MTEQYRYYETTVTRNGVKTTYQKKYKVRGLKRGRPRKFRPILLKNLTKIPEEVCRELLIEYGVIDENLELIREPDIRPDESV